MMSKKKPARCEKYAVGYLDEGGVFVGNDKDVFPSYNEATPLKKYCEIIIPEIKWLIIPLPGTGANND